MAALGALLGGYGSDEDDEMEQQDDASPSSPAAIVSNQAPSPQETAAATATTAVPAAAASPLSLQPSLAADSDTDTQGQQPVHIIDGPSTNPEPPPEGLSPPLVPGGFVTADDEGSVDEAAAAAECDPRFLLLPPELREAPPGPVHPHLQHEVEKIFRMQEKSGKSLMSTLRNVRSWNNPDFLEKMVSFYQLDQYGSSFKPEVWDPKAIPEEDYWPSLAQQLAAKKRQRGEQVKFTSAGQQQPVNPITAAATTAAAAAAVIAMGQAPMAAAAAAGSKVPVVDPRIEAAQAQAAAVAKQLLKKSKWDK